MTLIDDASAINLVEVDDNVEGGGDGTVDGAVGRWTPDCKTQSETRETASAQEFA
jgi:hypothetical protein